ncbi:MAG: hypothetical protein M0C28_08560 [Candidatus Moduliflexus flocculans]|nr:hypothetical protein [Candidatus Moduliflexus flocculans]
MTLADHILDIAENSVRAGAKLIEISIDEDSQKRLLLPLKLKMMATV